MKYGKKLSRLEKKEVNKQKRENAMVGSGVFLFENNTNGDLTLPKPTQNGQRVVRSREKFKGDSYYLSWVGSPMNLLRLIETIQPKDSNMKEKIILDQPDTITQEGKVEFTTSDVAPINDNTQPSEKDVLLTENPLDGVEIILGE